MINAQVGKDVILIPSVAITSAQTQTANLDCRNADYATIRINIGARKNSSAVGPTIQLSESDDTVVTNFATWNSNFTLTATSVNATSKEVVYHVDLRKRKKYIRLTFNTGTATNDDLTLGAVATLTRLAATPASTSDMVNTTNDAVVIG